MRTKLKLLGVYRIEPYEDGRRTHKFKTVLRLTTPSGDLREVELSAEQLLEMIGQCHSILTRMGPQEILSQWEKNP